MSVSCSDLLCGEDSEIVFSEADNDFPEYSSEIAIRQLDDDIEEYIAGIVKNEREYITGIDNRQTIDASLRSESVAWILKVRRFYDFLPLTAYLAVHYFDRFLCRHKMPILNGWPLQLLAVACLSLAAKMEEPLVPSLLDLQVESAKFMFEPRNIQRMELLVLRVLDWRLRSISPFCYFNIFALKMDPTGAYAGLLTTRAKELILSNIKETSFLEYRPSCIGAATILMAAKDLPNFSGINAQHAETWCDGLQKEKILSCYKLICGITSNRPKRQPKVLPQLRVTTRVNIASTDLSSSFSSYSPSFKRRKLSNNSWIDDEEGKLH